MKKTGLLFVFLLGVLLTPTKSTKAQTFQILANNTMNGAINGVVLGGAGMLIAGKKVNAPFTKNMDDLYALQVGLGLGTLYGVGMGAYDVVSSSGQSLLVSGFFNDATNTSAIILMDTFYGAAVGTVVSASITMLSDDPNLDAVQSGLGIGAYIGFGFGILDGFLIAERSTESIAYAPSPSNTALGLASIQFNESTSIGLVNPSLLPVLDVSKTDISQSLSPAVDVLNFRVNF